MTVFLSTGGSNGYYRFITQSCYFNPKNLSDVEFVLSKWFNKAEYAQFNSTVGQFVGYTAFGVHNAEIWNKDPAILAQWRSVKDRYCMNNIANDYNCILTKTGEYAKDIQ